MEQAPLSESQRREIQERKHRDTVIKRWQVEGRLIEVYVCPTPGCPNYFGINDMSDLAAEWNEQADTAHGVDFDPGKPEEARTFTRAECPDCRARGLQVERVRRVCLVLA